MAELKPPLVIDKSFANRKSGALSKWARDYTLIVPSAFYYEIFTTAAEKRGRELKDFPKFRRIHIPSLQRVETETGKPVTSFPADELSINPDVLCDSWSLDPKFESVLKDYERDCVEPTIVFWRDVVATKSVPGFSEQELTAIRGSDHEFVSLCTELQGLARIQKFAEEIEYIHAARLDADWIHYRIFQTWALHALVLLRRYPNIGDVISERRLEHDVHDIEYLTLGLHSGALATAESSKDLKKASMGWRFHILEPQGCLISA